MTVYEHTFPVSAIIIGVAIAAVLGGLTAWKFLPRRPLNALLFSLYVLILLGMGWCLLLPGFKDAVTQLRKPRFLIALDTSQSMTLTLAKDVPSRWDTAQDALKQPWLSSLAGDCEIEIFPFSSEVGEIVPGAASGGDGDGQGPALRIVSRRGIEAVARYVNARLATAAPTTTAMPELPWR